LKQFLYQQSAATQPAAIASITSGKDVQRIQSGGQGSINSSSNNSNRGHQQVDSSKWPFHMLKRG